MKDRQRIFYVRVGIEPFRQQDMRPDIYRPSPEFAEQLALYPEMFDITGVFGLLYRGDGLVDAEIDLVGCSRVEMDFHGLGVNIAGCYIPVLAFSPIHGQFDRMPALQVKGLAGIYGAKT